MLQNFEVIQVDLKPGESIEEMKGLKGPLFVIRKGSGNEVIDHILGQQKSLDSIYQGFGRLGSRLHGNNRDLERDRLKELLGRRYVEGNCYSVRKEEEEDPPQLQTEEDIFNFDNSSAPSEFDDEDADGNVSVTDRSNEGTRGSGADDNELLAAALEARGMRKRRAFSKTLAAEDGQ